jgi:hypothetical protein
MKRTQHEGVTMAAATALSQHDYQRCAGRRGATACGVVLEAVVTVRCNACSWLSAVIWLLGVTANKVFDVFCAPGWLKRSGVGFALKGSHDQACGIGRQGA